MTRREIRRAWDEAVSRAGVYGPSTRVGGAWAREAERLRMLYCLLPMM